MISFIIIGRNEGWKITKCLSSVFKTIETNNITNYEVIYVDSSSTDDSIERAKAFPNTKILLLTGEYNSAIARNTGVEESIGDVFFFIDGDMEIIASALSSFYTNEDGLKYPFCSGNFKNIETREGKIFKTDLYYKNYNSKYEYTVGGLFIITREIWEIAEGMRTIFRRSQEIDFGLRLAKKGYFLYRSSVILANHYTLMYNSAERKWRMILEKDQLYGRALLYKMNLFNKYALIRLFRTDFTLLALILTCFMILFFEDFKYVIFYLLLVLIRSAFKNRGKIKYLIEDLFYYPLRDIQQFLGFFLFWPHTPGNIHFKRIR